jgi:hypothetical protein
MTGRCNISCSMWLHSVLVLYRRSTVSSTSPPTWKTKFIVFSIINFYSISDRTSQKTSVWNNSHLLVVSWHRVWVAGFLRQRPAFCRGRTREHLVGKNDTQTGLSPRTLFSPVNIIPQCSMFILVSMLLLTRRTDGRHVANLLIKDVSGIGEQLDKKHFHQR